MLRHTSQNIINALELRCDEESSVSQDLYIVN